MIKFSMEFFEVLFPINLNPLLYRCPEELLKFVDIGVIVSAPIKKKIAKGVIIRTSTEAPPGTIKDIERIHTDLPKLNNTMINLLKWMSEYYLTEKGIVLKNIIPKEVFTKVKQRKNNSERGYGEVKEWLGHSLNNINNKIISILIDSIKKESYRTFLLHAPSSIYEHSFVIKVLLNINNAIILIPEVSQVDYFYNLLYRYFGDRVSVFHSGLSKGRRTEEIQKIISGISDIIIGTRSAIFAPIKNVSFIAVLQEHSSSYKQKGRLCYSGRDVAVMRGFLEKSTVLLSSITPSVESFYNSKIGKYTLIRPDERMRKTRVRILDMKHEKLLRPYLSKTVIDASKRYIQKNKKVMFLINRRGYSTLIQCSECNYIEECPRCKIPLIFHKQDASLKCHYCGYISSVSEMCSRCKGYHLELHGAGTQRVQEDIESLIRIKTLRVDSDISRKKSEMKGLIDTSYRDDFRIIIGTKLITGRLRLQSDQGTGKFSMAAILNTDLFMNLPDFRSTEKLYHDISSIMDKIEPQGEVFIQTNIPSHYIYKCIKKHDYNSFIKEELIRRKPLNYPPYSKLLLMKFISKKDISMKMSEIINKKMDIKRIDDKVEILGPSISKNTKGWFEHKLLMKSSVRGTLHTIANDIIEMFKYSKDLKIKVDVDPIST